jgi:hypothetical protein
MQSSVVNRIDASRKLSTAVSELEKGNTSSAITILEALTSEPGVKGISDEALFRLSLLKLNYEDKDGALPATQYLERLRRDYRSSIWAQQAQPLLEFLNSVGELKKQNRNLKILNISLSRDNKELMGLKNINQSLSKENKELHQSIERLKNLDIQLEKKAR